MTVVAPGATPESIAELRRRLGMPPVEWAEPAGSDRVTRRRRERCLRQDASGDASAGRQVMGVQVPLDALPAPLRGQVTGFQRMGSGDHAEARPVDLTGGRIEAICRWDGESRTWKTCTIYPKHGLPTERGAW